MGSKYLIVLATPDAAESSGRVKDDWMVREITDFCAGPNAQNLIVVRAAGEFDGPLPANLDVLYPNAQIVDLRGVTGWNFLHLGRGSFIDNEKLKIVASLLDIPSEEMPLLRREEELRRERRIGLISGVASAAIVLSIAISVYAIRTQIVGERALNQGLQSAEAIVTRVAGQFWDEGNFGRTSNIAVRTACNVANQLAIQATVDRDLAAMTACDLEYVLGSPSMSEVQSDQKEFFAGEFARLLEVADKQYGDYRLDAVPSTADLYDKNFRAQMAFEALVSRNRFEELPTAQQTKSEFDRFVTFAYAFSQIARDHGDAKEELAGPAANIAGDWIEMFAHRYFTRITAADASGSVDPELTVHEALLGLEPLVDELSKMGLEEATRDHTNENLYLTAMRAAWRQSVLNDLGFRRKQLDQASRLLEKLPNGIREHHGDLFLVAGWGIRLAELQEIFEKNGDVSLYDDFNALLLEVVSKKTTIGADNSEHSELYWDVYSELADTAHTLLDRQRETAAELALQKLFKAAKTTLIDSMAKREKLYEDTDDRGDWATIFMLIGEERLANYDFRLGNLRNAEERRARLLDTVLSTSLDTGSLSVDEKRVFDAVLEDISQGHLEHLRELHKRAIDKRQRGDYAGAAEILQQLLADDRRWDLRKPADEDFDRVYSGEIAFLLADNLEKAGQSEQARAVRLRAVREFLPLHTRNTLYGDELDRARDFWESAKQWVASEGLHANQMEPIQTLSTY